MNRAAEMTRQGVRNLDRIKGKSAGVRLPEPPRQRSFRCRHDRGYETFSGYFKCEDCGAYVEPLPYYY